MSKSLLEVIKEQGNYYIFYINNNIEGIKKEYFKLKDDIDLTEEEEKKIDILKEYVTKDQLKSIRTNLNVLNIKQCYISNFKYECSNRHNIYFRMKDNRILFMSVFGMIHEGLCWDIDEEERIYII